MQNRVQSMWCPAPTARQVQLERTGRPLSSSSLPFGEPHPWGDRQDFVTDTIFQGVTGRIFGEFQQARPDMTEAQFTHFANDVRKGLHKGIGEARGNLKSDESLSIGMDGAINDDENALLDRLEMWFDETRAKLFC